MTTRCFRRILFAAFCGFTLLQVGQGPLPAIGQTGQPAEQQLKAGARQGKIDTKQSRVYVSVRKTGRLGHDCAIEGYVKSGHILLGATRDAGEIVFDVSTFVANTAAARRYVGLGGTIPAGTRQQITANMLSPSVLDASRFPKAMFKITSAKRVGEENDSNSRKYRLDGKFTLHGLTRPLQVDVEATDEDGAMRLRGDFYLWQTQFGITPFRRAFGTLGIADQLTVYGEILLEDDAQLPSQLTK